jgi:ABC-2 type transport system permease protein
MAAGASGRSPGAQVPRSGYRFRHAARMEWIKLRSQRSAAWTLLFGVAATIGLGVVAGFNTKNPHGDPTNNILAGVALGQVVLGVLGVLVMTSEYSSGMIRATLAAIPRRPLAMAAKAAVFGAVALAAGEVACFAAFLAGVAALRPTVPHPALSQPTALRAVALTGAYLALIGLIGLGLGAIVRHGATAIAALVAIVFVLPIVGFGTTKAGQFLPELIAANSLSAVKPVSGYTLSPWAGIGVICFYAAALLGAGMWLLTRRDA